MKERLRMLRKSMGLNQTEMSARLKIAQTSYSQLETGRNSIRDVYVDLICREFGVSEKWLRTGEGPMYMPDAETPEAISSRHDFSPTLVKLMRAFDALDDQQKEAVLEYTRIVVDALENGEDEED